MEKQVLERLPVCIALREGRVLIAVEQPCRKKKKIAV